MSRTIVYTWVSLFVFRQSVKAALENIEHLIRPFAEGVQDAHQDFTGLGSLLRLRTEADLAGNDQRTQLAFGAVVVSRNG